MRAKIIHGFIKLLSIVFFCALFSLALDGWGVRAENIMMIFITGVLIVTIETKQLIYGVLASMLSVAVFNFFFTEPKYTFIVDDPNYLITFVIFLFVALIASTLTRNLQKQAMMAKTNAENSRILYEISSGSLLLSDKDQIIRFCIGKIAASYDRSVIVELFSETGEPLRRFSSDATGEEPKSALDTMAAAWCFQNNNPSGYGTALYNQCTWKYLPLKSRSHVFGVIGIHCVSSEPEAASLFIIETIASQLALAIERDILYRKGEESRLEIEKEKLRNSLLRSISHDLRTPLTAITGSTDFIIDSFQRLDSESLLGLLHDIGADAVWLNGMVENLLNMTRIQDGKLAVHAVEEVVDDLVQEATKRVAKLLGNSKLAVRLPDCVLIVTVDSTLIVQVLVNLLSNAIKHTNPGVHISLAVFESKGLARFEVRDDGPGIPEDWHATLFESDTFNRKTDKDRGMGLGLSLCNAIIRAHGGNMNVENNATGGACLSFSLPCTVAQSKDTAI